MQATQTTEQTTCGDECNDCAYYVTPVAVEMCIPTIFRSMPEFVRIVASTLLLSSSVLVSSIFSSFFFLSLFVTLNLSFGLLSSSRASATPTKALNHPVYCVSALVFSPLSTALFLPQ